jgi:hypothetical protein
MSIFRDTFTPEVRGQLTIRGKAMKDRSKSGLQYFNSRNAWVKMTSGVDVEGFGDSMAKNHVLIGGEALIDDNFKLTLKKGVGVNGAYSHQTLGVGGWIDNQRGIRPMPGITGVEIQSKSAYGSLRVATVNFICHDIRQLEVLELLYMRPGFLVLLEFGWTPWLDNNGNLNSNINFYDKIWTPGNENLSLQDRFKELFDSSKKHAGNYDAILGYVKNYEWSARFDGGYDCKTEIISVGEIIESLKINYVPNYLSQLTKGLLMPLQAFAEKREKVIEDYDDKIKIFYEKNILAGLLSELIYYGLVKTGGDDDDVNSGANFTIVDNDGKVTGTPGHILNFFRITLGNKGGATSSEQEDEMPADEQVYLDLDSLLKIINQHVIVHDRVSKKPIVPVQLTGRNYAGQDEELYCISHPLQISVDPTVCLIKTNRYANLKVLSISNDPLNAVITDTANTAVRSRAYQLIGEFNQYSTKESTSETKATEVLHTLYAEYGSKYNFKQLSQFLADAFEDYKVKTLNIQRYSTVSITYTIGHDLMHEEINVKGNEDVDEDARKQTAEIHRKISSSTWSDILIRDLGSDDAHLANFFKKYLTGDINQDRAKSLARDYFTPDANVFRASQEHISRQLESEITNTQLKETSDLAQETLSFMNKLDKGYFTSIGNKEFGLIGGIYINLGYALYLSLSGGLEAQDNKEKREINLYDYLKSIMKGVQESIGNLNNFDIHVDPIDNVARIIDVHYVDTKTSSDAFKNAFTFLSENPYGPDATLNGLFNNVRNYKMSSQIFKEQSAIVAISAQNGGGEMGLDNETLVGWNRGITDRISPEKKAPNATSHIDDKSVVIQNMSSNLIALSEFIKDLGWSGSNSFLGELSIGDRIYYSENAGKYKNALRDLIMSLKALTKCDAKFKSIIPTKLSLELDGIGGLVIGHIFRMPNELLPQGYKSEGGIGRRLGYIVTGVGHTVKNDWMTRVEAQTIILEEPDGEIYDPLVLIADTNVNKIDIAVPNVQDNGGVNVKVSNKANVTTSINFLRGKGYTDVQIAAIVGNLLHESGLSPAAFNSAGGGQGAYGIAQWRAERQRGLKRRAASDTLGTQLEHLHSEIQADKSILKSLANATDVKETTIKFEAAFERSGGHGLTSRVNKALYVYKTYIKV